MADPKFTLWLCELQDKASQRVNRCIASTLYLKGYSVMDALVEIVS